MPVPAAIERIERRPARLLVYERLRALIESGEMAPGEVIKDTEVAEALGTSRTPVREALQMLERDGAVEMLPGRLTRVTEVSREDIALLYAPLAVLASLATELATGKATRSDLARLTVHNEDLLAAIEGGDPARAYAADREFHGGILELADNPYLRSAIEPLLGQARRLEALYFRGAELGRRSYEDHRVILEAMNQGDATAAAEATRRNFQRFWQPIGPARAGRQQPPP